MSSKGVQRMKYPIYPNYDRKVFPVGFVDFADWMTDEIMQSTALVPELRKNHGDDKYVVQGFGLIPRTQVDTRPAKELGETPKEDHFVEWLEKKRDYLWPLDKMPGRSAVNVLIRYYKMESEKKSG